MKDKPRLPCCEPFIGTYPSGRHWTHAIDCPLDPNQKVGRKGAPAHVKSSLLTFLMHRDGCTCAACRYYSAHLDDGDDSLPRWSEVEAI